MNKLHSHINNRLFLRLIIFKMGFIFDLSEACYMLHLFCLETTQKIHGYSIYLCFIHVTKRKKNTNPNWLCIFKYYLNEIFISETHSHNIL